MRPPNEVWISVELLQQMFAEGHIEEAVRVIAGPRPEARIVASHVKWAFRDGKQQPDMVVLEYDRPVAEPVVQVIRRG